MAIEIREVVVKATVNKTVGNTEEYLTKADLAKLQDKITEKVLRSVKSAMEEARFSR
jgi:alcohol dehydrogenase YqhD (iron-dependent ADH family)